MCFNVCVLRPGQPQPIQSCDGGQKTEDPSKGGSEVVLGGQLGVVPTETNKTENEIAKVSLCLFSALHYNYKHCIPRISCQRSWSKRPAIPLLHKRTLRRM